MLLALMNRLPENHPQMARIIEDYKNRKSGYNGEKELDYYLSLTPHDKYHIFTDLRLKIFGNHFQIDTLLINPTLLLILEVKNHSGILEYDSEHKELIQIWNKKRIKHEDPVLQTKRQKSQLHNWLKKFGFPKIPIENFVVLSNKEVIMKFDAQNESTNRILYIDSVLDKLESLDKTYQNRHLTNKEIQRLSKLLLEKNEPYKKYILKEFNISSKELTPGVQCPHCNKFYMIRKLRTWFCTSCQIHSNDAHEHAIMEYLLIHHSITNKECREFLCLPPESSELVRNLLNRMNIPYKGSNKGRVYYLPQE